jgi:hypothetical protein
MHPSLTHGMGELKSETLQQRSANSPSRLWNQESRDFFWPACFMQHRILVSMFPAVQDCLFTEIFTGHQCIPAHRKVFSLQKYSTTFLAKILYNLPFCADCFSSCVMLLAVLAFLQTSSSSQVRGAATRHKSAERVSFAAANVCLLSLCALPSFQAKNFVFSGSTSFSD